MTVAKFMGVYATTRNPGARGQASVARKRHWFVWDDGMGQYRVQLLDAAFQPLDEPRIIKADEFFSSFEHEPHILVTPVRQLEIATPEDPYGSEFDDLLSGEVEPTSLRRRQIRNRDESAPKRSQGKIDKNVPAQNAVNRDAPEKAEDLDRELRAEFALALTRWRRGGQKSALAVFEKLAACEEGLIPAHKHMFTDFAIDLRKCKLYTLAVKHFTKAVELAPEDSNAHFNLARIYFETGHIDKAREELSISLTLTPVFDYAERFLAFLDRDYLEESPSLSLKKNIKLTKLSFCF